MSTPISFAVISDTHIGPSEGFELHGARTAERARRVVGAIGGLIVPPTFVIHLGDIVADPDPLSYRLAREIVAPLSCPFFTVAGNHDDVADACSLISPAAMRGVLPGPSLGSYRFAFDAHTFVVLEAHATNAPWNGALAEEQFDFLRDELRRSPESLTIFLHYPTRRIEVPWLNERMMLANGDRLHEALVGTPAGAVRGVFSGHIHRAVGVYEQGILYQSAAATSVSMNVQPGVTEPSFAPETAPMFSLVRYVGTHVIISHHQA